MSERKPHSIARSFVFAGRGIVALLRGERNARIHLLATIGVIVVGVAVSLSRLEWCALVLAIAGVWTAEALNTAVERLADASVPDPHPLIAVAKDVAAGGVLLMSVGAVVVGVLVFWPHLPWSS